MNEVEIRVGVRNDTGPGARQVEQQIGGLRKMGTAAGVALGAAGAAAGGLFTKGLLGNMNLEVVNDQLAGQLGLTTQEAKKAGEVAGKVYANNFGDSIEQVNEAIRAVGTNIGDVGKMTKDELQGMTQDALAFSKTMGVDLNLSTEAVGAMMKNGLAKNATEAFDILTAGMQNGVNKADDLLETFQEYSPQFDKLGIDGKDALNLLSAGLKAGARDTDVIADAFKELSIRTIDGTTATAEGFKALGMNGKAMADEFGKGGESARKATDKVLQGLLDIKDPVKQNIAGTALFGTQWEDTMKQILPAMVNVKGGIENVDGATKRMSDTVGDNAAGKIETMKRKFEQWTQRMSESEGTMGLVATGFAQFGGQAAAMAGNIGMIALAFKGLGAAMLLNPVGLVVLAIAGLAAGLVVLWKRSETAREIMSKVFAAIAIVVLTQVEVMMKTFKGMADVVLSTVEITLRALGKIPGNDWADRAADEVKGFKDATDQFLNGAIKKTQDWRRAAAEMPTKIKLQADERDLQAKLKHSQASLAKLPKNKRTVVQAEITQARRNLDMIRAKLLALKNRNVSVTTYYTEIRRDAATAARGGKASGGIMGFGQAASGGLRGGWTMVGERGPELVKLAAGSMVHSANDTANKLKKATSAKSLRDTLAGSIGRSASGIATAVQRSSRAPVPHASAGSSGGGGDFGTGGGDGPDVIIQFTSDGSQMGEAILGIVRKSIRARGGNVQLVLGS